MCADLGIYNGFDPFIAGIGVSLDSSKKHVSIKNLHDTRQAVVCCGVLSPNTEKGDFF